jgi:flavin-binding protein dodecin
VAGSPNPQASEEEAVVLDKTYRVTEIVGSSADGLEKAIRNGLDRAGATLRHLDWFQVVEIRGALLEEGVHFQVTMKVGFRLEDPEG